MRHRVVIWALVSSATAFTPLKRQQTDTSWTPARETNPEARLGWSPAPTPAPLPRYGHMDLIRPRADDFTLGTSTCGYVSGFNKPVPVTCVRESAYCTNDGVANMDCCTGDYAACTATMYSACLDFSASQRGECDGRGARTICWCVFVALGVLLSMLTMPQLDRVPLVLHPRALHHGLPGQGLFHLPVCLPGRPRHAARHSSGVDERFDDFEFVFFIVFIFNHSSDQHLHLPGCLPAPVVRDRKHPRGSHHRWRDWGNCGRRAGCLAHHILHHPASTKSASSSLSAEHGCLGRGGRWEAGPVADPGGAVAGGVGSAWVSAGAGSGCCWGIWEWRWGSGGVSPGGE